MELHRTADYRLGMPNDMPETFARRARHSSKAIGAAVALTLAALVAFLITSRDTSPKIVKTFQPVSSVPAGVQSGLVPVIDR
jgi:hypothetical protein